MTNVAQGSRRDYLTATTNDGKIELTEEELSRAAGGLKFNTTTKAKVDTYLTFELSNTLIS
jgi:hypothetical protein